MIYCVDCYWLSSHHVMSGVFSNNEGYEGKRVNKEGQNTSIKANRGEVFLVLSDDLVI